MTAGSEHLFPRTTALLKQAVRDRVFPGCAFGVLHNGETYAQGAGNFTYDIQSPRVEAGTVFDLASLTKVLATTTAAMLLYDWGELDLATPIAELLPDFANADPADARRLQVTVRMLLDHSSGLPGYGRLFETAKDRTQIIAACLTQPLNTPPGTRAEYSDIGFILLGFIVETLTGEPLDHFCQREIFVPLGMTSTGFCPQSDMRNTIPPTEDDRDFRHRVVQGEVHDENAWVMGGVGGHAGLFSHAVDPLRLASCILDGGVTQAGQKLFSAETISLFSERTSHPLSSNRALGWDTPSSPSSAGNLFAAHSIGHLGFTGTSLWIDLDAGIAACLLTNRTWPNRSNQAIRELRPRFHDSLRQELLAY